MKNPVALSRRRLLLLAMAAGGLGVPGLSRLAFAQGLKRTPGEILGPFYPVLRSVEKTADLTVLPGGPGRERRGAAGPVGTGRALVGQHARTLRASERHEPGAARSQLRGLRDPGD